VQDAQWGALRGENMKPRKHENLKHLLEHCNGYFVIEGYNLKFFFQKLLSSNEFYAKKLQQTNISFELFSSMDSNTSRCFTSMPN
jgi:hypothetical protein